MQESNPPDKAGPLPAGVIFADLWFIARKGSRQL